MKDRGLYIHIPFCEAKCAYCDFYSLCGDSMKERYCDALLLHMQDYAPSAMAKGDCGFGYDSFTRIHSFAQGKEAIQSQKVCHSASLCVLRA